MDSWAHAALIIGGVLAVAVGVGDLETTQRITAAGDIALMLGGFTSLGVKATGHP